VGEAAKAGFAVERGQVAPPLDFYKETDPVTGLPVGFATPTGRLEIYSVIAFQRGSILCRATRSPPEPLLCTGSWPRNTRSC